MSEEIEQFKAEWVDFYRPKTLDEYILNADIKKYFRDMVANRSLQNFTMVGVAGSGKTTLARVLCNEFDAEVLFVKCATEGTVDVIRSKIEPFCNARTIEGKVKIVVLDEIDSASSSGQNSFQLALRTLIEAAQDDTRFICTCNYSNKIQPAVLSRCPIIPLKYEKKDLLVYVKKILDTEKIKYTRESLGAFIEEAFRFYPDCRSIIKWLQLCCNSGELVVKLNQVADTQSIEILEELMKKIKTSQKIMEVRSFYMQNKSKIDDYKTFAAKLFNYAVDNNIVTDPRVILKMSDIIYQMNLVINPEIQFFALICLIFGVVNA